MTNRWHVSWKRVGIVLASAFCALWLLGFVANYFVIWYLARETFGNDPALSVVPVEVPDKTLAKLAGPRLEQFEYSFQVPWTGPDTGKTLRMVRLMSIKNGMSLMALNPATELNAVKAMKGENQEQTSAVLRLFGPRALSSNCDLLAAELAATPDQVRWWKPPTENTRNLILLNLKSMEISGSNLIYNISFGEMRGFQFGNPGISPFRVRLDLYDVNNRRYEIWIVGGHPKGPVLSQAEVNAMVASLRPIPHS